MSDTYHHRNLREAIMRRALEVIEERGPHALSLRALAADVQVSHTAPRHHFGDLRGILTAIAVEGFGLLGEQLAATTRAGGSFLDVGAAYVEFALEHRAHFAVMFSPGLLDDEDLGLQETKQRTFAMLRGGATALAEQGRTDDPAAAMIAAWGLMHGISTLALDGSLEQSRLRELADDDVLGIARRAAGLLFTPPRTRGDHDPENPGTDQDPRPEATAQPEEPREPDGPDHAGGAS